MHFLLSLLLSAGPLLVSTQLSNYAQTLQVSSQTIPSGKYYLENALTLAFNEHGNQNADFTRGQSLTYTKDERGHNLHLSAEGSGIYLKSMSKYTVLSPINSRNKCFSARE